MVFAGESEFTTAGYTVVKTNYAWTIADNRIFANYDHENGKLTNTVVKTIATISFCWKSIAGAASLAASADVIVGGQTFALSAGCNYEVIRPPGSLTVSLVPPTVGLHGGVPSLMLGNSSAGIHGEIIASSFQAGVGQWTHCQLLTSHSLLFSVAGIQQQTCWQKILSSGVDGGVFNFGEIVGGSTTSLTNVDIPNETLSSFYLSVSTTMSFATYLMFKPNVDGSGWVPIQSLTWNWQGSAAQYPPWQLVQGTPQQPTQYQGADTHDHPQWVAAAGATTNQTQITCP